MFDKRWRTNCIPNGFVNAKNQQNIYERVIFVIIIGFWDESRCYASKFGIEQRS